MFSKSEYKHYITLRLFNRRQHKLYATHDCIKTFFKSISECTYYLTPRLYKQPRKSFLFEYSILCYQITHNCIRNFIIIRISECIHYLTLQLYKQALKSIYCPFDPSGCTIL